MEITRDLIGKHVLVFILGGGTLMYESPSEYTIDKFSLSGKYVAMTLMNGLGKTANTWFDITGINVVDVVD